MSFQFTSSTWEPANNGCHFVLLEHNSCEIWHKYFLTNQESKSVVTIFGACAWDFFFFRQPPRFFFSFNADTDTLWRSSAVSASRRLSQPLHHFHHGNIQAQTSVEIYDLCVFKVTRLVLQRRGKACGVRGPEQAALALLQRAILGDSLETNYL